ncbi:hypothetical protein PFISCL1PPCAC_23617, partial [Pristionchus fissidentatus]
MLVPTSLLLLLLPAITLGLHDSDVSGICSINWDEIEEQLALDNSVCCNEKLHHELYRSLSKLNQKHANQTEVITEITPLIPSDIDAHIVATEGALAISAPGLGSSFCKQRVGAVHVLIQQSPISDPMGLSNPSDRPSLCNHPALTRKVGAIIDEWKLPGKMTGGQIVRIFAKSLYSSFSTRVWLTLSEKRVSFRSNSHLSCEFPVGDKLHLTVFTFQTLPSDSLSTDDSSLLATHKFESALLDPTPSLPPKSIVLPPPATDFSISETSTQVITDFDTVTATTVISPSTTVLSTTIDTVASPSFQKITVSDDAPKIKVRSEGRFKRQDGRARLGGCGNDRLRQIMETVLGPLFSILQMKLGDIAKRLQDVVQRTTGKSFEIMMGKGDLTIASHQMSETSHCRVRIGNFYTMIYETPIQYDINNAEMEKILSNIDFGEKLGGSGFPGQKAFSKFSEVITGLGDQALNQTGGLNPFGGGRLPFGGGGGLFGGGG